MSEERKMTWTLDQEQAIATHGCNLLVSAAAGSGKTAVLVERIIRMVTDDVHPLDIDRLMVVTFTNAAAGEMKERILAAVEKKLNEQPENGHLQRQMAYVNHANITTLHSFCLKVIRENFDRISIDPGFRIGEPGELELMKQKALADVIESAYESGTEEFYRFAESYAPEKSDDILNELVLQFYDAAESRPDPEAWLASFRSSGKRIREIPKDMAGVRDPGMEEDTTGEQGPKTEKDTAGQQDPKTEKDMAGVRKSEILSEEAKNSENEETLVLNSLWMEKLLSHAARMAEDICRRIRKAVRIAESPGGPTSYLPALYSDLEMAEKLISCQTYEAYASVFSCMEFARLKAVSKKDNVDARKKDLVSAMRKEWKDQLTKLRDDYFSKEVSAILAEEQLGRQSVDVLAELTAAFAKEYRRQKSEKNLVDFNDLEHLALTILCDRTEDGAYVPSDAGRGMAAEIDEIMVDEYQDINLLQDLIIKSVSREAEGKPNVFMVGDVKQSIYRFRLARPELFLQKYNTYGESGAYRRVILGQNFRSRSEVLSDINFLFRQIMTRDLGGISYGKDQALYPGASYPELPAEQDNRTEICVICDDEAAEPGPHPEEMGRDAADPTAFRQNTGRGSGEEDAANLSAPEIEGMFIAQKIKDMMRDHFQVYDKSTARMRDLTPGDVVVLVRTMKGFGETLADTLNASGIPAYCETSTGYFNTVEVRTMLHLLKALDNPRDDISLAAVLKSPIGGFSSEDLAWIKAYGAKKSFFDCCVEVMKKPSGEEGGESSAERTEDAPEFLSKYDFDGQKEGTEEKHGGKRHELRRTLQEFFARFHDWRRRAPLISLYQLIDEVLEESGYRYYVAAMPAGERRLKNLEMLMEKAAVYEESSYRGLFRFVRYIEKLREYEIDFGEAPAGDGGSGHVRVMSIHKSKGLEFPVVIVAGITKNFNFRDSSRTLLIHPDLGIGTDCFDLDRRLIFRSLKKKVIGNQTSEERLAEELCVLYVAATRAKEKLLFVGYEKGVPEERMEKYLYLTDEENEKLPFAALRGARCFLDFLMMGLMRCSCMETMYERMDCQKPSSDFLYGEKTTLTFQTVRTGEIARNMQEEKAGCEKKKALLKAWETEEVAGCGFAPEMGQSGEPKVSAPHADPFSFDYPYAEATTMPGKYSVSDVKHRYMDVELPEEEEAIGLSFPTDSTKGIPDKTFDKSPAGGNNSGTRRGTAYHRVLELWDYLLPVPTEEEVQSRVLALASEGRIPAEYEKLVSPETLAPFFASDLGRRIKRAAEAGTLRRESPFVMGVPANEIGVSDTAEEMILIQGMVDACFEEDGCLVLVDYKTDRLHTGEAFAARYQVQLDLYAHALEAAFGKPVKEKIIYSFEMEEAIVL